MPMGAMPMDEHLLKDLTLKTYLLTGNADYVRGINWKNYCSRCFIMCNSLLGGMASW